MDHLKTSYLKCLGRSLGVSGGTITDVGGELLKLVRLERSVANVDEDRIDKFVERYLCNLEQGSVTLIGQDYVAPKRVTFESNGYRVVFFGEEEVEGWKDGTRLWTRKLVEHGAVLKPETPSLGGVSWTRDEVAYVADACVKRKERGWGSSDYDYREDYGEKLNDVVEPTVYRLKLADGSIRAEGPGGQPEFCSGEDGASDSLAIVTFPKTWRKLGLTYCFNRPTEIKIGSRRIAPKSRSPRFHEGRLAYLTGNFDTHDGPVSLCVDGSSLGTFYANSLHRDCLKYDESSVVLNALKGADSTIAIVGKEKTEWQKGTFLAASHGCLLTHSRQSPEDPGAIFLGSLELPVGPASVVAASEGEEEEIRLETHDIGDRAFLVQSASATRLVVVPHGGPHSCSRKAYSAPIAFLASQGYACLMVNYRGSLGYGDETTLPGHISDLDVKDCVAATHKALEANPRLDPRRVSVCGGSHGGFLACHLIAKEPDLFKAAVMRNPVTNLLSMRSTTDIPDWVSVEAFAEVRYDLPDRPLSDSDLAKLRDLSPITDACKVTAPTLIALGLKDRRVPPSQGLEFYHALHCHKRLLTYPEDDHAIDKPKSSADFWINAIKWLDYHLGQIKDDDAPTHVRH